MLRLHDDEGLARSWNSVEEAILITWPEWAVGGLSSMVLSLDRLEQLEFGHPCFLPAFSDSSIPWLADKSDPCWPSHSLLASEVVVFLKDMLQCWFIRWCRPWVYGQSSVVLTPLGTGFWSIEQGSIHDTKHLPGCKSNLWMTTRDCC